jgi:hypothetical protein
MYPYASRARATSNSLVWFNMSLLLTRQTAMIVERSELRALNRFREKLDASLLRDERLHKKIAVLDSMLTLELERGLSKSQSQRKASLKKSIERENSRPPGVDAPVFFAKYPHLLMPLGFDEFRVIRVDDEGQPTIRFNDVPEFDKLDFAYDYEIICRESSSGA